MRESRWWSSAISPSSLTSTAVSPSAGSVSSSRSSVVLPLPRKPVISVIGVRSGHACVQRSSRSASSGSIGAPGETLGLDEERGEIGAQHGLARARAQHVGRALPLRDRQRQRPQDAVQQLDAPQAIAHPGPPRVEPPRRRRAPRPSAASSRAFRRASTRGHCRVRSDPLASHSQKSDTARGNHGQGDSLRLRRRHRRGRRLDRLVRRRRLARRHLARPVRRRGRDAAHAQPVRAQRHQGHLVHPGPLDRDVPRAGRGRSWRPATRSGCTATRTRTRSR